MYLDGLQWIITSGCPSAQLAMRMSLRDVEIGKSLLFTESISIISEDYFFYI